MTPLTKVEKACTELTQKQQPVTFTAIAASTGLSRATLYRQHPLRAVIEEHRIKQQDARTLTGLATEIGQLRDAVQALADNARRHEEQIRRINKKQ